MTGRVSNAMATSAWIVSVASNTTQGLAGFTSEALRYPPGFKRASPALGVENMKGRRSDAPPIAGQAGHATGGGSLAQACRVVGNRLDVAVGHAIGNLQHHRAVGTMARTEQFQLIFNVRGELSAKARIL